MMTKPFNELDEGERANILERFDKLVDAFGEPVEVIYKSVGTYVVFNLKDGIQGVYKWLK